ANPACGKITVPETSKVPTFTEPLMVDAGKVIRSQAVVVAPQAHQGICQAKRFSGLSGTRQLLVVIYLINPALPNPVFSCKQKP
ncbi:hypothetical protein ACW9I5_34545, partial [Pseudomonas azotoformans]